MGCGNTPLELQADFVAVLGGSGRAAARGGAGTGLKTPPPFGTRAGPRAAAGRGLRQAGRRRARSARRGRTWTTSPTPCGRVRYQPVRGRVPEQRASRGQGQPARWSTTFRMALAHGNDHGRAQQPLRAPHRLLRLKGRGLKGRVARARMNDHIPFCRPCKWGSDSGSSRPCPHRRSVPDISHRSQRRPHTLHGREHADAARRATPGTGSIGRD